MSSRELRLYRHGEMWTGNHKKAIKERMEGKEGEWKGSRENGREGERMEEKERETLVSMQSLKVMAKLEKL